MIVIAPLQFIEMPWKNGLGTTTEIHRADHANGEMAWRVSIAGVPSDGPFSVFPGYDRHIMVIDGAGMVLKGAPEGEITVAPVFASASFAGDWNISANLLAGPVRDFNLIVRRDFGRGELVHVLLPGPYSVAAEGTPLLLYLLTGQLLHAGQTVPEGSALLFSPGEHAALTPVQAPARIALCRIWPAAVQ